MIDAEKILADLQAHAGKAAREFDVSGKMDDAKAAAEKLKERLETDPNARTAATGAGGLLLLGLLGTRGGRRIVGDIAKAGAVAALGALAYRAWAERQGQNDAPGSAEDARALGFPTQAAEDPEFALAVIRAMLAAAYADGVLDAHEARRIDEAMARAGVSAEDRKLLSHAGDNEAIEAIAAAARTPNHAAELYAAAVVAAGDAHEDETAFLRKLSDRLGVGESHAAAIRRSSLED